MKLCFQIALLIVFLSSFALSTEAAPAVWVTHSNERVMQNAGARTANSIELHAARGEWEPFQIVVRGPASGVNVSVSELRTTSGAVIPQNAVTLYREHYIYEPKGNPVGSGPGWYPDPLIPFVHPETGQPLSGARFDAAPFSVASGKSQPVWADLFVPRNTPAGKYTGTVTVTSNEGSATATVILNVWNFELPLRSAIKGEGNLFNNGDKASRIEILKHKVSPRSIGNIAWQDEFVERYGMQTVDIGIWSGSDQYSCAQPAPPSKQAIQEKVSKYRSDLITYSYFADEVYPCLSKSGYSTWIKNYAKALQEGGATPLLTVPPVDGFWIAGPYIWVGSIGAYNNEFIPSFQKARKAGQEAWSYHMFSGSSGSPKWFFDSDPIEFRIHTGFLSQALDITGFLFWRMDFWKGGAAGSWTEVMDRGDGHFVYAGSEAGVPGAIGGIRLKRAREGFEDYEYVALLKKAGEGAWALEKARSIAPDKSGYTHDFNKLAAVRKELGERLHQLGGGPAGGGGGGTGSPTAGACNLYGSGAAAPAGYGAAWNPLTSARELLISGYCNADGSVKYTVGSGATNQYVYKTGYFYAGAWTTFNMGGTFVQNSADWLQGQGAYTHANTPSGDYFWVGYVCHWTGTAWKCGCRDGTCAQNFWQLQGVKR